MDTTPLRLNKILAEKLGISRREADDLIANKKALVNGQAAVLGQRVLPSDDLVVDGKPVNLAAATKYTYIMLNKPVGYVCSRHQQGDNPTIYSLLPENLHALKPVGRLDKDSSGLILLTNDGDFAHQMTHPKFYKSKVYEVELHKALKPLHQQMINDNGISLVDGISKLQLERLSETDNINWRVTMSEGRNRQIRRTFSALGYEVMYLNRTQFGDYNLNNLAVGKTHAIKISN